METEVIMKRELFGREISQKSKSEYFSATDLVKAGNMYRIGKGMQPFDMSVWFSQKNVKEFVQSLENKFGKVKISGNGRGHHTWVHPYLFIDMALSINPDLKIEVYGWLYDCLLKYRNDSGDSYKKMAGAIYSRIPNKSDYTKYIIQVADKIKETIGVDDWQHASETQLELRDIIHDNISLLSDVLPVDESVRIGIKKAMEDNNVKSI